MIALRRRHPLLREEAFYAPDEVTWFDASGRTPDWSAPARHLGCRFHTPRPVPDELCVLCNAEDHPLDMRLPEQGAHGWHRVVDTAATPAIQDDIVPENRTVSLMPFSLVVLERAS